MEGSAAKLLLRIAPVTYGPNVLFGFGEGAFSPFIPVIATGRGADLATAGIIASLVIIGRTIGNLPAGWFVARIGERWAIFWASLFGIGMLSTAALSTTIGVFALAIFAVGLCDSVFGIARHSFMTTRVPLHFRARAISLLGGTYKFGFFLGPFVGAMLLGITGNPLVAAWFFAGMFALVALLVVVAPDPQQRFDEMSVGGVRGSGSAMSNPVESAGTDEVLTPTGQIRLRDDTAGVFRTMMNYRSVLLRLGISAASFAAVRTARIVLLPLWGLSIGLDAQSIALVMGVSGAIDFALFYVSGQVMDRFGRMWCGIPSLLIQAVGFIALAFTHDLDSAAIWYVILACFIAAGNGFSSGILMTLGSDVAPQHNPAPFLGSWRTLTDAGGALAPLVLSSIAAVTVLAVPTALAGLMGVAGAWGIWTQLPRFIGKPEHHARSASRAVSAEQDGSTHG